MGARYMPVDSGLTFYSIPCPRCGAGVAEYCSSNGTLPLCSERPTRWKELGRPKLGELEIAMLKAVREA